MAAKQLPANRQIELIKSLGYEVVISNAQNAEQILNQYFPGLNPYSLFLRVDGILSILDIGDVQKSITLDEGPPPKISIEFFSVSSSGSEDDFYLHRTLVIGTEGLIAKHDILTLPRIYRNLNVGKAILAAFLQQYEDAGVKKITLLAALSTGGYAWARAGFKAVDKDEMEVIRSKARQILKPEDYDLVARLYNDYYNENSNGKAFPIEEWARLKFMKPILLGSRWNGELDLTDPKELTKFRNYVTR